MLSGLYVLTDDRVYPHHTWPDRIEKIIRGGANVIQLREKTLAAQDLLPLAHILREICRAYSAIFIINDHIELARLVDADGVHIGKQDQSLRHAREYLGHHFFIGVSCYNNLYQAIVAQQQTADYVAFGSLFASTTKSQAVRCPLSIISRAKQCLKIPVCTIGGINQRNCKHALTTGTDLIAVSHAVFNADNPHQAANNIHQQVIISH